MFFVCLILHQNMVRKIQRIRFLSSSTLCSAWAVEVCTCEGLHCNAGLSVVNHKGRDFFCFEILEDRVRTRWASLIRKYDMMRTHDRSFIRPVRLGERKYGGNVLCV